MRYLESAVGVLVTLGIVLSCAWGTPAPPASVTQKVSTATPAGAPPTATAPADSPAPLDPCPALQSVALPARPEAFLDYAPALRDYLSAGGAPENVRRILADWDARAQDGVPLTQADLTGDGVPETVASLSNPTSTAIPPEAMLAIFVCRNGRVETLYTYRPGEWFGLNLVGAEDMDGDGVAELLFAEVSCGAHTCWHTLHVWAWEGVDFEERIGGDFSFPYPTFAVMEGQVRAGSAGIASVGAGPQRPITTTLAWVGDVVTATETALAPARFRYHVFRDGEVALLAGNYARALDAYLQVLNDDGLQAWAVSTSSQEERRWLEALARWRLVKVELLLNNPANAEAHYQSLVADFEPGEAGYAVVPLAERFWETYRERQALTHACAAAVRQAEVPAVLDFLNDFGYANAVYTPGDVCPFFVP